MQVRKVIYYLALLAILTSCQPSYKVVESSELNTFFLVPPNEDKRAIQKMKWRGRVIAKDETPTPASKGSSSDEGKSSDDGELPIQVFLEYNHKEVTVDLEIDYSKFQNTGKNFSAEVALGLDSLCAEINGWQNKGFPAENTVILPYLNVVVTKKDTDKNGSNTDATNLDTIWRSFQTFRANLYNEIPLPLEAGLARYRIHTGLNMTLLEVQPDLVLRVDQEHLDFDINDKKYSVTDGSRRIRIFSTEYTYSFTPLKNLLDFNYDIVNDTKSINQLWDINFLPKFIYLYFPKKGTFDRELLAHEANQTTDRRINFYLRKDFLSYDSGSLLTAFGNPLKPTDTPQSKWFNFGRRSFIIPEIEIHFNGHPLYAELGTSLKQLLKQQALFSPKFPEGIRIERFNAHLNRFVSIHLNRIGANQDIYLLPADRITFSY